MEYGIILTLVSLGVGIVNGDFLCSYFKAMWLLVLSFQTHWKRKDLQSQEGTCYERVKVDRLYLVWIDHDNNW